MVSYNTYDYIIDINATPNSETSLNDIFNVRDFVLNNNNYLINLNVNSTRLTELFYSFNTVNISSNMNTVANSVVYNTLDKTSEKLLGLRFLEIIATKIFGHAKARAAIRNDTKFYESSANSAIQQVIDGINTSLYTKKMDIFNTYINQNRYDGNLNNIPTPVNFNFDASNWEFPVHFSFGFNDTNAGGYNLLNNGPNVGGAQFLNGTVSVPILIRFNSTSESIVGTQALNPNISISYMKGYTHALSSATTIGFTKTIINKNSLDIITGFGSSNSLGGGVGLQPIVVEIDSNNILYTAGNFTTANGQSMVRITKWNGSSWVAVGSGGGLDNEARGMVADNSGNLYVGGNFTTVDGNSITRVAKWDGSSWSALGTGLNGMCQSLDLDSANNVLYATGDFTTAGGVSAARIAKWDGSSWSALGSGLNSGGLSVKVYKGYVYVGGNFTTAGGSTANRIARWNISTSSWSTIGTGVNGTIRAITFDSADNLYVGGGFSSAGGNSATRIAKWNGTSWSALGSGLNALCFSLAVDQNDNLYAGGQFTTAGGVSASAIAKWTLSTSTWSTINSGLTYTGDTSVVRYMKYDKGVMYAVGYFNNTDSDLVTKFNTPNTITGTFKKNGVDLTYLELNELNESTTLTWQGTYWNVIG